MDEALLKSIESPFHVDERLVYNVKLTNRDFFFQEHISRYEFAAQFVNGKKVLDIACGTAYGTAFLAQYHPRFVVGVDVSHEALQSGDNFPSARVNLLAGDATKLGFSSGVFETVISFETLEHLQSYENFISEIKRVLSDDGVFVISTPNKRAFSGQDQLYLNHFHFKEFTMNEFSSLLGKYFVSVQLFGEGKLDMKHSALREIRKILLKKTRFDPLKLNRLGSGHLLNALVKPTGIYPLQIDRSEPKFFIAVCKKQV